MKNYRIREVSNGHDNTANDEAIARAIADSEETSQDNYSSSGFGAPGHQANCPGRHGLELFQTSPVQRVTCNGCQKRLASGDRVRSCVRCNYDVCEGCYQRGYLPAASSSTGPGATSQSRRIATPSHSPTLFPQPQFNNPFSTKPHMCMIPCMIGNITIEMLVDTGAQTSVLSETLASRLGLLNRLDRSTMGVAAGVGRAQIIGSIRNVVCTFGVGHVEFLMDFIVLDVQDSLAIIGLDQLRKYKCLVDLEHERIIFGGAGGVEVPTLPAERQHFDLRSLNGGCILM